MAKKHALAQNYESVTVAASEIGCTEANVISGLDCIMITAEEANMRFRIDGDAPTSNEGHLFEIGDTLIITGYEDIKNFLIIREGDTSGTIRITYFV